MSDWKLEVNETMVRTPDYYETDLSYKGRVVGRFKMEMGPEGACCADIRDEEKEADAVLTELSRIHGENTGKVFAEMILGGLQETYDQCEKIQTADD